MTGCGPSGDRIGHREVPLRGQVALGSWAPPSGRRPPPRFKILGDDPKESRCYKKKNYKEITDFLDFLDFQNKVTEIQEEFRIWGWAGLTDQGPPPPQSKLCGGAPGWC